MKEATGELNMTIVTLVAISAIGALLWFVVWPIIQRMIVQNTCQTYGSQWWAVPVANSEKGNTESDADVSDWKCCKAADRASAASSSECFETTIGGGGAPAEPEGGI